MPAVVAGGQELFLEKFARFFRQYDLTFRPRHKGAAYIPLAGESNEYSARDALQTRIDAERALDVRPNGDVVELMKVEYRPIQRALVLLFHRANPDAAEPTYRKKARLEAGTKVTIRQSVKEEGEEQSVSAHLVIHNDPIRPGVFRAALEEIPGISMSTVRQIIGQALHEYTYEFQRKNEKKETYCTFKPEGLKSETLTGALEKGHITFITLVRPAKPNFVDAEGIFEPVNEVMKLKVKRELSSDKWQSAIAKLVSLAKKDGWQDFNVEIDLDDQRRRTVKLDRDQEAKEILFVRSEQATFKNELPNCSIEISDEIVVKALAIIRAQ